MHDSENDISFTQVDAYLKQHRSKALSDEQKCILNAVFPAFLNTEQTREVRSLMVTPGEAGLDALSQEDHPARQVHVMAKRHRRFAGDETLPQGCYHVVAVDEDGNDHGTLLGELSAYAIPNPPQPIYIADLCSAAGFLGLPPQSALLLILGPRECQPAEINEALNSCASAGNASDVLEVDGPAGRSCAIRILYVVERCLIDKVVDLRLPETQEWFWRAFGVERRHAFFDSDTYPTASTPVSQAVRAEHQRLFPAPENFLSMLPGLLTPDLGGGWSPLQAIGAWLRLNGVAGLIFPSARMNCGVEIKNGKLQGFRGWNFVDYRGSGQPLLNAMVPGDWPASLGPNVQIVFATDEEYRGSWRIEGLEEELARQHKRTIAQVRAGEVSLTGTAATQDDIEDPLEMLMTAMAQALTGDLQAKLLVSASIDNLRNEGLCGLANGIARILDGQRDITSITTGLTGIEEQLLRRLVDGLNKEPRSELPPFRPTLPTVSSDVAQKAADAYQPGPDWFLFKPGDRWLQIHCPQCHWEDLWDRGEERKPEQCPRCGFDGGATAG